MRWGGWNEAVARGMNTFVFNLALPALLFNLMSGVGRLPRVDGRLLGVFFGACLLTFLVGRIVAASLLHLDGTAASILAVSGIFSNNVLLGLPLARVAIGPHAVPAVALILVFNALSLWTLVSVSIEWSRHGSPSLAGFRATLLALLRNPIVMSIIGGTLFGLSGVHLPGVLDATLRQVAEPAAPLSLIVLGMGLAEYAVHAQASLIVTICVLKLLCQPLLVWALARATGLPTLESEVAVMLGSLPVGANVYLMAAQYQRLEGTVAASLVISTALSALSTPLFLVLLQAG
ncbi:MAG: AEC family transporter [Pseudomonadota bacterium]|nr:AEC family transporter [Pseudomonadota bacterium]